MTRQEFWQGMGLGVLAGTLVGMTITPRRRTIRDKAGKVLRSVGSAVEDISDSMGM